MPRERVQHGKIWKHTPVANNSEGVLDGTRVTQYDGDVSLEEGEVLREDPSLEVTWNRDAGWVQVSYVAPNEFWDQFQKDHIPGPHGDGYQSVATPVLTRKEINDMIRTLRRARDAAYGRDE